MSVWRQYKYVFLGLFWLAVTVAYIVFLILTKDIRLEAVPK